MTAKDNSLYKPTDNLRRAIEEDSGKIQAASGQYQALRAQLSAILNRVSGASPGTDLATAINAWQAERGKELLVREQQAEAARRAAEQAQQNQLQEEKLRQQALDQQQQVALEKQRREHERLLQAAQNPLLVQRFAPFLGLHIHHLVGPRYGDMERGNKPVKNPSWPRDRGGPPVPLSVRALNSWGALSNVDMFVAIAITHWNERPNGDFREIVTPADRSQMQKLLDEFNYYKSAWVELGMLQP